MDYVGVELESENFVTCRVATERSTTSDIEDVHPNNIYWALLLGSPTSNLGLKTFYPDWNFSWFFLFTSRKMLG
jgi:hypothetical protein